MIVNLLILLILLILAFSIYILYRNNKVYCFRKSLSDFLFDELKRILNTYNGHEFREDENNYCNISKKVQFLLDKYSYNKYLYSFKPLKLEKWFTKEELEFIEYLKQYRKCLG